MPPCHAKGTLFVDSRFEYSASPKVDSLILVATITVYPQPVIGKVGDLQRFADPCALTMSKPLCSRITLEVRYGIT